jgi:protein-arginine kinase activator protein McsA
MSLALTQRVKDLEKMVSEQSNRISVLENQKREAEEANLKAMEDVVRQLVDNTTLASKPEPKRVDVEGKKLCPKCQKVPGYFFHVRSCKG